MDESVSNHVIKRFMDVEIQENPYPHFFIDNLFPEDFYQNILDHLPQDECYIGMGQTGKVDPRTYQERSVLQISQSDLTHMPFHECLFWTQFSAFFDSTQWHEILMNKFGKWIKGRFQEHFDQVRFSSFAELVRDRTNYALGPHTDHPIRVLTLLFYFPKDESLKEYGTSVYEPLDDQFRCEGLSHHSKEGFSHIYKAPHLPNSLFGFVKSDVSFHGVEKVEQEGVQRNLLNYYLQWNPIR